MRGEATENNLTLHRAFQRKAAFETMPAAIVIGLQPRLGAMKWDNPPLALFAAPPLIGLISSYIGFQLAPMIEIQEKMLSDMSPLILSWFALILFASVLMLGIPKEWGEPKEMRLGVMAGVVVIFLPQMCGMALVLCSFWFLAIIGGWVFVSTYQWKYDVQPFRTGLWLGVGGLTGMFMGAWAMSAILNV